jgi:hypothetical protein
VYSPLVSFAAFNHAVFRLICCSQSLDYSAFTTVLLLIPGCILFFNFYSSSCFALSLPRLAEAGSTLLLSLQKVQLIMLPITARPPPRLSCAVLVPYLPGGNLKDLTKHFGTSA